MAHVMMQICLLFYVAFVPKIGTLNSGGSPYGDPDQLDASLGTLTQQRKQEV